MKDKIKIIYEKIENITPYINNPRKNDNAIDIVAASIKEFGFKNPIVIDKNNVIVNGHTRYKAARKLKFEEVPTISAEDLTEAQIKAFRIADNKTGEFAEWDDELLKIEFEGLKDEGFDIDLLGFDNNELEDILKNEEEIEEIEEDEKYTNKIEAPFYEPKNKKPELRELYDNSKYELLIDEIKTKKIPQCEKDFLIKAAGRHVIFNYDKIADYYSHSEKDVQELMEKSALIIIDFDKSIEYGYTKLNEDILQQFKGEHDE